MTGRTGSLRYLGVPLSVVLVSLAAGCFGIPRGTMKEANVGASRLYATCAGIVKADTSRTVYKTRCERCGLIAKEKNIATPTPDAPFSEAYRCPRCHHKQIVVILALPRPQGS